MKKRNEVPDSLLPLSAKGMTRIYAPERWRLFTKSADITQGYGPDDLRFVRTDPPALTPNMEDVRDQRYAKFFPNGVKRAGKFPGTTGIVPGLSRTVVNIFDSGFLDWRLTLPCGDEFDRRLERDSLRMYFNIHQAVVSADDKLLYVVRSNVRESWNGAILGVHSFGYSTDVDGTNDRIMDDLLRYQGAGMFFQAQLAVLREFNPAEKALIQPHELRVDNGSCFTLHVQPNDFGIHLCFVTHLLRESGNLLKERADYPMSSRVAEYCWQDFNEGSMVEFFAKYHKRLATTTEPAILMACVQRFGPDFLKSLPYECNLL